MFLFLLALWIVFNGAFTLEILLFGIVISAAVCYFAVRFLDYSFKREFRLLKCLPDFILYLIILVIEIFKSNVQVLELIFKGNEALHPAVYHFKTDLKSRTARTILANSITLTPGTITMSMHDGEFYVNCLDASMAEGIDDSVFVRRLRRMEEKVNG